MPVRRQAALGRRRCGPVDEPVRLGQDPDLSFAPAPLASFELGADGAPPRLQVQAVRAVRPQRAAADPHHRVRARAAAPRRRSDAQPVSRHLSSPVPRALLPRLGAGAAARQPRSPEGRSLHGLRRRVRRHGAAGVCAIATRCPDLAKFFHVGALIRQVRNAEGLAHILSALLPRAGADRGVRRPLAALGAGERTLSAPRRSGARRRAPCSAAACGTVSTSSGFASAR